MEEKEWDSRKSYKLHTDGGEQNPCKQKFTKTFKPLIKRLKTSYLKNTYSES